MIIPSSTYRIQFTPTFHFKELSSIIDYLEELGITAIYASPILEPTRGSQHGYDGINVTRINPELGNEEEFEELSSLLRSKNMAWIQDIVPNHLAFHTNNVWLRDVLERGMNSTYASHFDIDWEHPACRGKLMAPFLGEHLYDCLDAGKIQLAFRDESGFTLDYYDQHYPVSFDSYARLLSGCCDEDNNAVNAALGALVNHPNTSYDHWLSLKADLLLRLTEQPIRERIEMRMKEINADKQTLLEIINAQHYALCVFTETNLYINYRRFFNINGLICLRMEDEHVFQDYHRYIHSLYQKGFIQGLRIDHIDGLRDPHDYIRKLRRLFGEDCYIIVEKILDKKEELPASMDIQGTSGYEFLSYINQVITDQHGAEKLVALYREYVPESRDYHDIVFANKFANLETYLNGEWDNLLRLLLSLNLVDDEEIRVQDLKMALGVFMAAFPVYRVYIEALPLDINDEQLVVEAFAIAHKRFPELEYELGILRQLFVPHPDPTRNMNRLIFIQRLMQFTGPLAAKGIEDTTFYSYNALISHNEVGDQPCVLGIPVREFHEKMQERWTKNALSFNCTSTHDTKRGEDNRVRINVISELSDEWIGLVRQWMELNEPFRKQLGDLRAPIINDEYFLYQAITGGFPEDLKPGKSFVERTKTYFTKALRESKVMSDHINPNLAYEGACNEFIDHLFDTEHSFLDTLMPFVKKIIGYANTYAMVQVIIKTTAPGIPDIYQGCELWDLSYVDPDNRRPVDFNLRKQLLATIREKEQEGLPQLLHWAQSNYTIGAQKLLVTSRILQLRKAHRNLFIEGEYLPVYYEGSDRVIIAYMRHLDNLWVMVVLPLGIVAHTGKELCLHLPPHAPEEWRNIFTGETVRGNVLDVKAMFHRFPVAVLISGTPIENSMVGDRAAEGDRD